MKKHIFLSSLLFVVVLSLCFIPVQAFAGAKTILPEDFQPSETGQLTRTIPHYVTPVSDSYIYIWAPVKLPTGARIKKLEAYTWGEGNGHWTVVTLFRAKLNEPMDNTHRLMIVVTSDARVGTHQPPMVDSNTLPTSNDADLIVRRGYRYYVQAWVLPGSYLNGVKVYYKK